MTTAASAPGGKKKVLCPFIDVFVTRGNRLCCPRSSCAVSRSPWKSFRSSTGCLTLLLVDFYKITYNKIKETNYECSELIEIVILGIKYSIKNVYINNILVGSDSATRRLSVRRRLATRSVQVYAERSYKMVDIAIPSERSPAYNIKFYTTKLIRGSWQPRVKNVSSLV